MAINGMATYGRTKGYLSLSNLPDAKKEYVVNYDKLDGGLNIYEMEYRLESNESPDMKNLIWVNGALGCRDGQSWLDSSTARGVGYATLKDTWLGCLFFHIGTGLYWYDPEAATPVMTQIYSSVPEVRGTFFRYKDYLLYKTTGAYIQISYANGVFTATDVTGYVPVLVINASYTNGSGDLYQPENRLSAGKTIWYNAATITKSALVQTESFTGDGSTTVFTLAYNSGSTFALSSVDSAAVGGTVTTDYTTDLAAGTVTFVSAPADGVAIVVVYGVSSYIFQLPIDEVDSVDDVIVDGVEQTVSTDYLVNLTDGRVGFAVMPPVTTPATNNTVKITYSKANPDAYNAIMDCRYGIVYGGNQDLCVVLAGSSAQPNAYFWNGNTAEQIDLSYFPIDQYNLAGDSQDEITGFGEQQDLLVIFTQKSVGRAAFGTTTIDERNVIELPYTSINAKTGCDLPWTIQLVENNLVWCNTEQGVQYLSDSSAAYENNIKGISLKVNGYDYDVGELSGAKHGLLYDVRNADADTVCSTDDEKRYWLVANGHVYVWDYQLSSYSTPSWFYFTAIAAIGFVLGPELELYHLDSSGRLTYFSRSFVDYDGAIEKRYTFPAQNFDTYDRYKNITSVLFAVRSDTDTVVDITYRTDWGERADPTPIRSFSWRLVPRNLEYRFLGVLNFATVARRKPGARNVRHFAMTLTNNTEGNDLSVIKAQVFYKLQGRQR